MKHCTVLIVAVVTLSCFLPSRGHDDRLPDENVYFYIQDSFDVKDLDKIYPGENCDNCPRVYYPICANDSRTYINECRLHCRNIHRKGPIAIMVRTGPCAIFPVT